MLTEDGELFIFDADPAVVNLRARWKVSDSGPTWSHLAVAGGRLYVKDRQDVLCFDLSAP